MYPIFFAQNLALPTSTIFALFLINSLGCLIGYILMQKNHNNIKETSTTRVSLIRALLVISLLFVGFFSLLWAIILSVTILALSGLVYAFYSVSVLSLSIEIIPQGKTGIFTALLGAGTGIGCLTGPIIAENLGFSYTFIISTTFFLLSFAAFKIFTTSRHKEFL